MELVVSDVPAFILLAFAFIFGATWGSFFNVAIYRWPLDMSVVSPPSHCPHCGSGVAARFNVPIFGYLILRGKTACCGAKLSPRYPMVELLTAILCMAVVQRFVVTAAPDAGLVHSTLIALLYFTFAGGLLIATFVDLDHMQIPDEVSLPGAALGLASVPFRDPDGVTDAALGAGLGFLVIQVVFVWSYEHVLGRRGMGEGDSKLLMMIGAFLGWQGVLFAVFAGAAQGLVAFLISLVVKPKAPEAPADVAAEPAAPEAAAAPSDAPTLSAGTAEPEEGLDEHGEPEPSYWGHFKIPFGPFLSLGALEFMFFGERAFDAWIDFVQMHSPFGG